MRRERDIQRRYGITLQQYLDLFEQQGHRCAICGSLGFKLRDRDTAYLVVDHDHATGKVRGLLCHDCNRALGMFQDSPQILKAAIKYLKTGGT